MTDKRALWTREALEANQETIGEIAKHLGNLNKLYHCLLNNYEVLEKIGVLDTASDACLLLDKIITTYSSQDLADFKEISKTNDWAGKLWFFFATIFQHNFISKKDLI